MVTPTLLVVDDEPMVRTGLMNLLRLWGYPAHAVASSEEALEKMADVQVDIVIADIRLPGMSGLDLLKEVSRREPEMDFVMITAYDMEFTYMDVVEAGAADFITKPFEADELRAKLHRIVNERQMRERLRDASRRDSLTRLGNRRAFEHNLKSEVARALRQSHDLSLLVVDVDGLKRFNDREGHESGDALLVATASTITECLRQRVDTGYRIGGDEFAVILVETASADAAKVAQRLIAAWDRLGIDGCSVSVGVASLVAGDTPESLLRRADATMYQAKQANGSAVESDSTPAAP